MSLSARELIRSRRQGPFMQWKARAKELIGENIPNTKGEILEGINFLQNRLLRSRNPRRGQSAMARSKCCFSAICPALSAGRRREVLRSAVFGRISRA